MPILVLPPGGVRIEQPQVLSSRQTLLTGKKENPIDLNYTPPSPKPIEFRFLYKHGQSAQ